MNTPWPVPPLARDIYERHPNSSHEVTHAETRLRWERNLARRVAERLSPLALQVAIREELEILRRPRRKATTPQPKKRKLKC